MDFFNKMRSGSSCAVTNDTAACRWPSPVAAIWQAAINPHGVSGCSTGLEIHARDFVLSGPDFSRSYFYAEGAKAGIRAGGQGDGVRAGLSPAPLISHSRRKHQKASFATAQAQLKT